MSTEILKPEQVVGDAEALSMQSRLKEEIDRLESDARQAAELSAKLDPLKLDMDEDRRLLKTHDEEVVALRDALAATNRQLAAMTARHAEELAAMDRERAKREPPRVALLDQRAAMQSELRDKSAQVNRWWASANHANREIAALKASWSWRLTKPLREIARAGRSLGKSLRRTPGSRTERPFAKSLLDARRQRFSRAEISRFLKRQGRSIRKRVRRLLGLPPELSHRSSPAFGRHPPFVHSALSDEAQLILRRIARRRDIVRRHASAEPGPRPE